MRNTDKPSRGRGRAAFLAVLASGLVVLVPSAGATDVGTLESKVADARSQASSLAAELEAEQSRLVVAQQQAAAAAAQEQQLTALLAAGEQRAAELAQKVSESEHQLALEKQRLRRARAALAQRLVAIYKGGTPDVTDLVLGSRGFDDLVTQMDYIRSIQEADTRLAQRVEDVRDAIRHQLKVVADAKRRADAYNARLTAARDNIASVRAAAESEAAQLAAAAASRQATIATLRSSIGGWIDDIQAARAAATAAQAQAEVGRWLGGPYSIPTYIVMCESGGNYSAVNPSSGAGGAYQILPSTWDLYGGQGNPQDGSKSQQDQIAAQIWADSGPGAWVCAG